MEGVNGAILRHQISCCRHLLPNIMKNMFQLGRFHSIENICGTLRKKVLFIRHWQFCSILRPSPSCFSSLLIFRYRYFIACLYIISFMTGMLLHSILCYLVSCYLPFIQPDAVRDLCVYEHSCGFCSRVDWIEAIYHVYIIFSYRVNSLNVKVCIINFTLLKIHSKK